MSSITRQAHRLNREKTMAMPRHFVFFDTETTQTIIGDDRIQQDLKLGWCVYYRRPYGRHKEVNEWFYFETVSAFWEFLFERVAPKQRLWVIARNIVFDFTVCKGWQNLRSEGYKLKFFHNNGVSVIVTVNKGNRSIAFLDSMNWFTESLAKTGERIGIPKMDIDFSTCSMEYLSEYCKNDVLIECTNFKTFIRFLEGNSISRLCYTKASTAMAAYMLRHYHTDIYIHNNYEALALEREAYKGGRCECFHIGDLSHEKHYVVDVNSLYPSVMRENLYPVKYHKIWHEPSLHDFILALQEFSAVAKVMLKTDEAPYAVKRDRTIFPVGTFETSLCTPELLYAIEHDHIVKVLDCVLFEQAEIFTSYVNTMYALRQDFQSAGIREYEQICKYLLNSLYGKWGQKAENWVKIGDCPDEPDREEMSFYTDGKRVTRIRYLLGQVFELKSFGEAYNSFPAISAHVTAYGRMKLWSLMQLCGVNNYVYCDTDSLIVNAVGMDHLASELSETELGKLKVEYTTDNLLIRGLKDYTTDKKTVVKGVRKSAEQLSEDVYKQESWPSFRGLFKSDDANTYTVGHVTKHLNRTYAKGTVLPDGVIEPFVLE